MLSASFWGLPVCLYECHVACQTNGFSWSCDLCDMCATDRRADVGEQPMRVYVRNTNLPGRAFHTSSHFCVLVGIVAVWLLRICVTCRAIVQSPSEFAVQVLEKDLLTAHVTLATYVWNGWQRCMSLEYSGIQTRRRSELKSIQISASES